jgi:hypothetical protein
MHNEKFNVNKRIRMNYEGNVAVMPLLGSRTNLIRVRETVCWMSHEKMESDSSKFATICILSETFQRYTMLYISNII